jgi:hypothetical protein
MSDQIASLTTEPAIFQQGLPPANGIASCTDCCVAMIVRHETGKTVTAAQVRAVSGSTNPYVGLTPSQALRALAFYGVRGYAYHTGVTASDVLRATASGLVLTGVGYYAYPTLRQAEIGGKDDMSFYGPHAILIAGYRDWETQPAPGAWGASQVPFAPGYRCWGRDPDHRQGWKYQYDRYLTSYLSRAMAALIGSGSPAWQTTFMLSKGAMMMTATGTADAGLDTPIDQPTGGAVKSELQLGRLAPYPEAEKPRLSLGPRLADVPPPEKVDWYSKVPVWPMYLNDQLGDCTVAEVGHQVESASAYAQTASVIVRDADVLAMYQRVSGYNPADPSTDQGARIQDVLSDWRHNGIAGHKCLAFAQVHPRDHLEVMRAVSVFSSLDLGMYVPASAKAQFHAGLPWRVVANDGGLIGGHSIEVVGYDPQWVYVVTWGTLQPMSWGFWDRYVEEAWAVVLPEWLDANGKDPQGIDLYGLGEDFATLTGQANPFPKPPSNGTQPPPAPDPNAPGCISIRTNLRRRLRR